MVDTSIYWAGLFTGAGLIIAIGAQNAFVLTQAVRGNHSLAVAGLCAFIDALLIAVGVCGAGAVAAADPRFLLFSAAGGAAFLIYFGARSLKEAFAGRILSLENGADAAKAALLPTLGATLAVSLLNPHVYLDTVIMLGTVSANFPGQGKYVFGLGAASASILWFFSLSLAGRLLAPLFQKPEAWRVLHLFVTATVWWVAYRLISGYLSGHAAHAVATAITQFHC